MKKPSNLLDQVDAVGNYLADMLSEPLRDVAPSRSLVESQPVDNLVLLRRALEELPDDSDVNEDGRPAETSESQPEQPVASRPAAEETRAESQLLDFPLQCLMFSVGNQHLSMPLVQMSGVVEVPETLSRLPGSADCVRGVFQYRGNNVQLIDSASLLGIKRDQDLPPTRLIVLQGDQWAVSADNIADVVVIEEADVKWHKTPQSSLMMGTIKSSLAQLLNPVAIVNHLNDGDFL